MVKKTRNEIVEYFETKGKEEFPFHLTKDALMFIEGMGDQFNFDDFTKWYQENLIIGSGSILRYLQARGFANQIVEKE